MRLKVSSQFVIRELAADKLLSIFSVPLKSDLGRDKQHATFQTFDVLNTAQRSKRNQRTSNRHSIELMADNLSY